MWSFLTKLLALNPAVADCRCIVFVGDPNSTVSQLLLLPFRSGVLTRFLSDVRVNGFDILQS